MKIPVSHYELLLPMDVDKKTIHLVAMKKNEMPRRVTLPYNPANLLSYVRKHYPNEKGFFLYEAGPTGYGLYDFLRANGQECEVAVSSMIAREPGQRVKTNRLDAFRLGIQARTDEMKFVVVPEIKYRDLRHLTRSRLNYSKRLVGVKNAIKGLFLFESIDFPEGKWSRRLISKLQDIDSRTIVKDKMKELLEDLKYYRTKEMQLNAKIRKFCRAEEEINQCILFLMSIPGIGWTVASYVLAALGGYKHLKSAKKTSGFFGLGPREHSTGTKVRKGEITAIGDPCARKMIVQASWVGIQKDHELRSIFNKVYSTHSPTIASKKAIIAVSRRMVCRIHAVLRDQRVFKKRLTKVA
jgi:transposase